MKSFFIVSLLFVCGCSYAEQVNGNIQALKDSEWVSDKEATLKWIAGHRPNLSENATLQNALGKMKVRFSDGKITTMTEEKETKRDISFIREVNTQVVIELFDPQRQEDVLEVVEFSKDRQSYSVYNSLLDFKEFFRRVDR